MSGTERTRKKPAAVWGPSLLEEGRTGLTMYDGVNRVHLYCGVCPPRRKNSCGMLINHIVNNSRDFCSVDTATDRGGGDGA